MVIMLQSISVSHPSNSATDREIMSAFFPVKGGCLKEFDLLPLYKMSLMNRVQITKPI